MNTGPGVISAWRVWMTSRERKESEGKSRVRVSGVSELWSFMGQGTRAAWRDHCLGFCQFLSDTSEVMFGAHST